MLWLCWEWIHQVDLFEAVDQMEALAVLVELLFLILLAAIQLMGQTGRQPLDPHDVLRREISLDVLCTNSCTSTLHIVECIAFLGLFCRVLG